MEAKDLMIGDWIMDGNVVARVTSLTCDGIIETTHRISNIEVVEPILLTPEILEKNKFEVYEQDFTSNTIYKFGFFDYMEFEGFNKYFDIGSRITYRHFGREITYIHSLMRIYFVHELQHALKLCGIEKEVTL